MFSSYTVDVLLSRTTDGCKNFQITLFDLYLPKHCSYATGHHIWSSFILNTQDAAKARSTSSESVSTNLLNCALMALSMGFIPLPHSNQASLQSVTYNLLNLNKELVHWSEVVPFLSSYVLCLLQCSIETSDPLFELENAGKYSRQE